MPSGRVHFCIETGILAGCAIVGAGLVRRGSLSTESLLAFAFGFAFGMFFLSPDLDLTRSRPTRRWGWLSFLWWPYAKIFRHRGVSHHVIWGPLTRLGYLALIVGAVAAAVGALTGHRLAVGRLPIDGWAVLVGVYVPNVAHVLVDGAAAVLHRGRA
jgi:uncharacterized metal-binding protein